MAEVTCRFIEPVGWRLRLTALWDGACSEGWGCHAGRLLIDEILDPDADPSLEGTLDKHWHDPWWASVTCDRCGAEGPGVEGVKRSAGWKRFYDTETGNPAIGDMFWVPCWPMLHADKCFHWDNCEGRHLYVVLPDGHDWDADSRAKNCTLPKDRTHRCWVRTGDPPNVHVSKTGHTCSAGAGSIATGKWHGFLRHGKLVG